MTPKKNVALEPELFDRVGELAEAEGKTVDELANETMRRELLRRGMRTFVAKNRKDADEHGLIGMNRDMYFSAESQDAWHKI